MGAGLKRKTFTIDVLLLEMQRMGTQITDLESALNVCVRVLAGVYGRDSEMLKTLSGMKGVRRRAQFRLSQYGIRRKEMGAATLLAQQNLSKLREDVDEVMDRVEKMRKKFESVEVVVAEPGSGRDV